MIFLDSAMHYNALHYLSIQLRLLNARYRPANYRQAPRENPKATLFSTYHTKIGDSKQVHHRSSHDCMRFFSVAESNKHNTGRLLRSCVSQVIDLNVPHFSRQQYLPSKESRLLTVKLFPHHPSVTTFNGTRSCRALIIIT